MTSVLRDSSNLCGSRETMKRSDETRGQKLAATRLQAIARGRTGRRRSMDMARERFGYLRQQQQQKSTDPSSRSRSRSRGSAHPPIRVHTRPVAKAPPGAEEDCPADRAVELATSVLERIGRVAVMSEVVETCRSAMDDDVRHAIEKGKAPSGGARWDVAAKLKARDEKLAELRAVARKLWTDRSRLEALSAKVETALLREVEREREKAAAADRALVDGSGLRDRLERLEHERDEAREQRAGAEASKAAAEVQARSAEEAALAAATEAAEARRERDTAIAETRRLGEAAARETGGLDGLVEATTEGAAAARRERDDARAALEEARVAAAAERERWLANVEAERAAAKRARDELTEARSRLEEVLEQRGDDRARAERAAGAAELARRQYESARDELQSREGDRRRLSEARRRDHIEKERVTDALEAALDRASAAEAACWGMSTASRDALASLAAEKEGLLRQVTDDRDAARHELAELQARATLAEARAQARADELRARAQAAEEARDRASIEASKTAADKEAQRARAEAADTRASIAEATAHRAKLALEEAAKEARTARSEADAASKQLAVESCLRNAAQEKEESERRERTAALAQLLALRERIATERAKAKADSDAHADLSATLRAVYDARADIARKQLLEAEACVATRDAEIAELRQQLESATESKHAALELSKTKGELEALRRRLADAEQEGRRSVAAGQDKVHELEERLRDAEQTRRKLHNLVQELKGNIRVFARVRPFLPSDEHDSDDLCRGNDRLERASPLQLSADGRLITLSHSDEDSANGATSLSLGPFARPRPPRPATFTFDKVFPASSGQDEVFDEVRDVIQSALDGYQVCLFAYGQTGSGKTHTMCGSGQGVMRGIIPRALEQVSSYLDSQRERGWRYELKVTYLEVYNETVRDLLVPDHTSIDALKRAANLELKRDPKTGLVVAEGATYVDVSHLDAAEIDRLMTVAARHRCVAATDMNAVSSRSHAIFSLHVIGIAPNRHALTRGALNLIDLAGSERLAKSGAVGDRAKEAAHINKSLSALAGVFSALAVKRAHIPYRDSKLTFLLQNGLNGKTLLIVNLSPSPSSANESLSTLKFAQQAARVELGKATRTIVDKDPNA